MTTSTTDSATNTYPYIATYFDGDNISTCTVNLPFEEIEDKAQRQEALALLREQKDLPDVQSARFQRL